MQIQDLIKHFSTPSTLEVDVECTYEYHPAAALFLGPPRCPRPKFHLHLHNLSIALPENRKGRLPRCKRPHHHVNALENVPASVRRISKDNIKSRYYMF